MILLQSNLNNYIITNFLSFVIAYLFLGIIFFLIAQIETSTNVRFLFYKKQRSLITEAVFIFLITTVLLYFIKELDGLVYTVLFLLLIRVIMAIYVAKKAHQLGRNNILWGFLGFIQFHIALIVLGTNKRLVRSNNTIKTKLISVNEEFLKKKVLLDGLNLSPSLYRDKLRFLQENYYYKIDNINKVEVELKNRNIDLKLKDNLKIAYENEILTESEYLEKLAELDKQ